MIKKILFLCMTLMILLMPKGPVEAAGITAYETVSYTHLTLPTT